MENVPRQELIDVVKNATSTKRNQILSDPDYCKSELENRFGKGSYIRETNVIIMAHHDGVIGALQALTPNVPIEPILEKLTDQLVNRYALFPEAARWAVDSWAMALDLEIPQISFHCTWEVEVLIHAPSDLENHWKPHGHTPGKIDIPPGYDLGLRPLNMEPDQFPIWVRYLENVERIKYIDLSGQEIDGNNLDLLTKFQNLEQLDLINTNIDNNGLQQIGKLAGLKHLDLSGCQDITQLEPLSSLRLLSTLNLGGTNITNNSLVYLSGLSNLKHLDLKETSIEGPALIPLDGLRSLTYLDLSSTGIQDATLASLCKYPNLQTLWLDNCENITNAGLAHLRPLNKLRKLGIANTRIDDQGVKEHLSQIELTEVRLGRRWRIQESIKKYLRQLGVKILSD